MKEHYGKEHVPRCAKRKRLARTKQERKEIQKLIKTGRRMARRVAQQELRRIMFERNKCTS
jgi:HD-GYP domain-containing protein (c-di-GMP phosphodiesterase class II)